MGQEKDVVRDIRHFLEDRGFLTFKIHVGRYGPRGFPDLIVIKDGVTTYFEAKVETKEPTSIQEHRINCLREAGCVAGVVRSIEDVCTQLNLERYPDVGRNLS